MLLASKNTAYSELLHTVDVQFTVCNVLQPSSLHNTGYTLCRLTTVQYHAMVNSPSTGES